MVFALLFFASFVLGLLLYLKTERWWMGGVVGTGLLLLVTALSFKGSGLQGVAVYFGVPIIFFGSLFGAYIVQLRRAPELSVEPTSILSATESETTPESASENKVADPSSTESSIDQSKKQAKS